MLVTEAIAVHNVEIGGYSNFFNSVCKVTKVDRTSHYNILSIIGS
jgi:hypothetical protein